MRLRRAKVSRHWGRSMRIDNQLRSSGAWIMNNSHAIGIAMG